MRLFSPDLYRNFGIGFVFGAVLIVGANAGSWSGELAPAAQAAEPRANLATATTPEFVIAPEGR